MAGITLAFDPSASMSKGLYAIEGSNELRWTVMEPEVIEVTEGQIEAYEQQKIGRTDSENEAWITVGSRHYAVGYLARTQFWSLERNRELKYEQAVYKVLGMVGALGSHYHLPGQFTLNLGLLLPYSEYRDSQRFELLIKDGLKRLSFRGRPYQIELKNLICLPEGGGLAVRGRIKDPKSHKALILMVGHRNASYLLQAKGQIVEGDTTNLGFFQLLETVCQLTSGYKPVDLLETVFRAGEKADRRVLKSLVRSQHHLAQKSELDELVKAVKIAREQHFNNIVTWLHSQQLPAVEEVILSGGTAYYYREDLPKFLGDVHWAEHLEKDLRSLVPGFAYRYRLTDLYGFWYYFCHQIRQGVLAS